MNIIIIIIITSDSEESIFLFYFYQNNTTHKRMPRLLGRDAKFKFKYTAIRFQKKRPRASTDICQVIERMHDRPNHNHQFIMLRAD